LEKRKKSSRKKTTHAHGKAFITGRVKRGVGGDMLHIALPAQMKNKKKL